MPADVVVVGLGGMGSAVACELARRGRRVVGLDRFDPPHEHGSSHGRTRIIRKAYFEDPAYVPLVLRAYERWVALERDAGVDLLTVTGGLAIGAPDAEIVSGALASAREHDLEHEVLDHGAVLERFPVFALDDDEVAVLEPDAGVLVPEACVTAHLELAARAGAELATGEEVTGLELTPGGGVRVVTSARVVEAEIAVVVAGAWLGDLELGATVPTEVERQYVAWFRPADGDPGAYVAGRMPVFLTHRTAEVAAYGIPDLGDGVKLAFHHGGETGHPDELPTEVTTDEVGALRAWARTRVPGLDVEPVATSVCRYTNTPDGHFAIGHHPEVEQVIVAGGFSGHGFKFASVVGEVVADLATGQRPAFDLAPFALDRFP